MILETKTRGCLLNIQNMRSKTKLWNDLLWDNVRKDLWYSVYSAIENPVISFVSKSIPDHVISDVSLSVCIPTNDKLRQYVFKHESKAQL
jgi:hypothetical protein